MDNTTKTTETVGEFFILGLTQQGKPFRPSDWADRLCGAMTCFRPKGKSEKNAHLRYSPFVRPALLHGVHAVVVDESLREIDPLAYHFVVNFAKDNDLQVLNACLIPDPSPEKRS